MVIIIDSPLTSKAIWAGISENVLVLNAITVSVCLSLFLPLITTAACDVRGYRLSLMIFYEHVLLCESG